MTFKEIAQSAVPLAIANDMYEVLRYDVIQRNQARELDQPVRAPGGLERAMGVTQDGRVARFNCERAMATTAGYDLAMYAPSILAAYLFKDSHPVAAGGVMLAATVALRAVFHKTLVLLNDYQRSQTGTYDYRL